MKTKLFYNLHISFFRSSCLQTFCKIVVPKNFEKFTGKHLCQSLFLMNLQHGCLQIFFKKEKTLAQVFPCEFWETLRLPFFYNTSRQLLLIFVKIAMQYTRDFSNLAKVLRMLLIDSPLTVYLVGLSTQKPGYSNVKSFYIFCIIFSVLKELYVLEKNMFRSWLTVFGFKWKAHSVA